MHAKFQNPQMGIVATNGWINERDYILYSHFKFVILFYFILLLNSYIYIYTFCDHYILFH